MASQTRTISDVILLNHFEKSDLYNSPSYIKNKSQLKELENLIEKTLGNERFNEFKKLLAENEQLCYKFGFVDGVKFCTELSSFFTPEIFEGHI